MNMFQETLSWLADSAHWSGASGVWIRLLQHLEVTALVVLVAAVLAIPLGILIGHTGRGAIAVPLLSGAARALPTLGLLTLFGLALGIGLVPPMLALLILAIPPVLAGAYAGIAATDRVTVNAARAIGLTEWQVMSKVEIPSALPLLLGGLRSATLQVAATATLAAYTADSGLGRFIFAGLKTRDYPQMFAGVVLVILLALVLDLLWAGLQRGVVKRAHL